MDELLRWSLFRNLKKPSFLPSIKLVHVHHGGDSALVVDTNDCVWRLEKHDTSLEWKFAETTCQELNQLSGRKIIEFANGKSHYLALSETGRLYGWGSGNSTSQVGRKIIPSLCTEFEQYRIVKIACGNNHSLALTSDGKLFSWGSNAEGQCGQTIENGVISKPSVINESVIDMCAGLSCSVFLTKSGAVYFCGQKNSEAFLLPHLQSIAGKYRVIQVEAGIPYILALCDNGTVFTSKINRAFSEDHDKFDADIGKFVEIAACKSSAVVAALSSSGCVYVWGKRYPYLPTKTACKTLDSVFAETDTFRNLKVNLVSLQRDIQKSFNNPDCSDCKFRIGDEIIHAHRTILSVRSEYLRTMLSEDWSESGDEIQIHNYSYQAYHAFIQYLYTDTVDVQVECLVELVQLAHEVLDQGLLSRCIVSIQRCLSEENVCEVFMVALNLDLTDLMESCRDVAAANLMKVVKSRSYARLSPEDGHRFVWYVSRNELKRGRDDGGGSGEADRGQSDQDNSETTTRRKVPKRGGGGGGENSDKTQPRKVRMRCT